MTTDCMRRFFLRLRPLNSDTSAPAARRLHRRTREEINAQRAESERQITSCLAAVRPVLPRGTEVHGLVKLGTISIALPEDACVEEVQQRIRSACSEVVGFCNDSQIEIVR